LFASENRGGIKQEEDQRCPKASGLLELNSFFSGQDFHSRKGFERAHGIWKRKKKKDGGRRENVSYETLARVTLPFTLQHPASVPFLRIPLLSQAPVSPVPLPFRGTLFSSRSWRWYIKRACNLILVKAKKSILLRKEIFASFYL